SHSLCFKPSRRPKDRVAVNILEHVATCCSFFEGRSWEACLAPFRPWRLHMLSGIGQQAASMNLPQEEYQPHHRSPGPTFNRNQLQEAREKYPLQERRHRPCRLCLVHTVGPDVHPSRCPACRSLMRVRCLRCPNHIQAPPCTSGTSASMSEKGCFLVSRHHCQWHIAKRTMFGNSSIMKAVRE
ncbi:unnamed protein product, partial [Durusdinium trenchii]